MNPTDSSTFDDREIQYRLTERQLLEIEADIKATQPLTSRPLPIAALINQYSTDSSTTTPTTTPTTTQTPQRDSGESKDSGFRASSELLTNKYTHLRRIRGDGNCYYRAFLYSICEGLLKRRFHLTTDNGTLDQKEYNRIRTFVNNSLSWVCSLGYDQTTIEMFYDELVDLLDFIDKLPLSPSTSDTITNHDMTTMPQSCLDALHDKLNEENSTSDYCTWYLRVLTAAQMKSDPDRYLPFLLADDAGTIMDIPTFCSREVEPMNRECGMVQVAALAECFGVKVVIEYMDGTVLTEQEDDGSFTRKVPCHEFGETHQQEDRMSVSLLYRPGHYDILY